MISIWNKTFINNVNLFQKRFNDLYSLLEPQFNNVISAFNETEKNFSSFDNTSLQILQTVFPFWQFVKSKSGELTVKENNLLLHSSYAPIKESDKLFTNSKIDNFDIPWIFAGIGLGYAPIQFCKKNAESLLIIIEPDPFYLFASMSVIDWTPILEHKKCVIITATTPDKILPLLEKLDAIQKAVVITNNSQTNHQTEWYKNFFTLLERNKQKQIINTSTLEKFSTLWLKNSSKNLKYFCEYSGISIYKNMLNKEIPALVCAAGPTLQEIIPYLKQLKERFVLIAVDTAVKTLLRYNIQPDFILLIDPQYYAACHIQGLKCPTSTLVIESSVYPSVLRFSCKKKVFIESLFELGKYFESKLLKDHSFGKIIAGGSVSTSCWDFAKYIGAKEIYMAGLDLGYPQKMTHVKGSTFEEKSHTTSIKIKPAENNLCSILFSAANEKSVDYQNNTIITDSKMKLFAWWFESQLAKENDIESKDNFSKENIVKTFSLSSKSLKIPGMNLQSPESLLSFPLVRNKLQRVLQTAESTPLEFSKKEFNTTLNELTIKFTQLTQLTKKGLEICNSILELPMIQASLKAKTHITDLLQIDSKIANTEAKKIVSIIFPSERQLDNIIQKEIHNFQNFVCTNEVCTNKVCTNAASPDTPSSTNTASFTTTHLCPELITIIKSRVIYRELQKSILTFQKSLSK